MEDCITEAQRRRVFGVLFLSVLVTMIGVGIIAPFMPIYAKTLGASGTMVGFIFGAFSMARLVTMPFFGRWSDRAGRKNFIATGFLIYTFVSIGFIAATKTWHLVALRAVQGASAAMILPIAMAYVGEISKVNHEARSMNSISIALFLGFAIGPITGGFIHEHIGMSTNFAALGLASFVAFALVMFLLPEIRANQCGPGKRSFEEPATYREILASPIMRGVFAFRLSNALGRGALMTFLPLLADERLGISIKQIGILVSANLFLSSILQKVFAPIADKWDRKKMVVIGNLVSAGTLLLIPMAQNFTQLLVINLGMGVAGAISLPAANGIVVSEGRKFTMGSVMAVFNMAMSMGLASGPILGGVSRDT
jgi:MFS family permease